MTGRAPHQIIGIKIAILGHLGFEAEELVPEPSQGHARRLRPGQQAIDVPTRVYVARHPVLGIENRLVQRSQDGQRAASHLSGNPRRNVAGADGAHDLIYGPAHRKRG